MTASSEQYDPDMTLSEAVRLGYATITSKGMTAERRRAQWGHPASDPVGDVRRALAQMGKASQTAAGALRGLAPSVVISDEVMQRMAEALKNQAKAKVPIPTNKSALTALSFDPATGKAQVKL